MALPFRGQAAPIGPGFNSYPYPQLWDHRGCSNVYPESTMLAYQDSLAAGCQFVEMDCQLSSDGELVNIHDDTLNRTTTGAGPVSSYTAAQIKALDVDIAPGRITVPALASEVVARYRNVRPILIEAKATGSGQKIVDLLTQYNVRPDHVIINSFVEAELVAPLASIYPVCLNIEPYAGTPTPATIAAAGYDWVGVPFYGTSEANIAALRAVGLNVAVYTVGSRAEVARANAYPVDAVYCNDGLWARGLSGSQSLTDPFAIGKRWHGCFPCVAGQGEYSGKGAFRGTDEWGYTLASANVWAGAFQGWASPIGGSATLSGTTTIDFSVTFEAVNNDTRTAWIALTQNDTAITEDTNAPTGVNGYLFVARRNGTVQIYRWQEGLAIIDLGSTAGTTITLGATANYRITVNSTNVKLERLDVATVIDVANTAGGRGAYMFAGVRGSTAWFKDIAIAQA